jgi:predicted GH43/DUF377 family glycosyl hydrolase
MAWLSVPILSRGLTAEINVSLFESGGGGRMEIWLASEPASLFKPAGDPRKGLVIICEVKGPFVGISAVSVDDEVVSVMEHSSLTMIGTSNGTPTLHLLVHSDDGIDFAVWANAVSEKIRLKHTSKKLFFGINAMNLKECTKFDLDSVVFGPDSGLEDRLERIRQRTDEKPNPWEIDTKTVRDWSDRFRNWTYYSKPMFAYELKIPGHEAFHNWDVPCVYQIPEFPGKWFISFIAFNGKGYNSFVAESTDLVNWEKPRLAFGFGGEGEFDHGGRVVGAYMYNTWDIKGSRALRRKDGLYWTLYGCYPRQGGYELRPGAEGLASSQDGLTWTRAWPETTLDVYQKEVKPWEHSCIYQPWLVEHQGKWYDFYNAANGGIEQSGFATSTNLVNWTRYPDNPVIRNRPQWSDASMASDPKVFWDTDHWVMFYFGNGKFGVCILVAFSTDLEHWTQERDPLYKPGGHPGGYDKNGALKISLVWNPVNEVYYMFYNMLSPRGMNIGLLTSKRIE